jgi:hypothetical protein
MDSDQDQTQTAYTIKTLEYDDGAFDSQIDATYIIHLKNNGREPRIFDELAKFHPTNTIHIVYNEGFRRVDKGPRVKTTVDDLTHTYLWTFEHAVVQRYRNILILEDDFIFGENIQSKTNQKTVCDVLESRKSEDHVFLLGCLPFLMIPRDLSTYTGITCGMHCAIYSEQCIRNTLANRDKIVDWDIFFNFVSETTNKYVYPTPLCYQLFPVTENSTNWGIEHDILIYLTYIVKPIMRLCRLDKQVEPGYSVFYLFSKILGIGLSLLVIYIIAVYPLLQNNDYIFGLFPDGLMRSSVLNTHVPFSFEIPSEPLLKISNLLPLPESVNS